MPRISRSFVTAAVLLGGLWVSSATRSAFAQGDPAVGTWKLNLGKSKYSPGPAPKSQTITITAAGNGIRVSAKGVDGDGKATSTEYTASYDGRDVPVLFNLAFTPLQFGLKNNLLAALDIVLVLATLIWALRAIWPQRRWVALANLPYLAWVMFATALQLSITWLNR